MVLPGSRTVEIRRHSDPFEAAIKLVAAKCGPLELVLPTVAHRYDQVKDATARWEIVPRILVDPADRRAAFRNARAALASSGTVTLELALAGVPAVVAYKGSLLEYLIFRPLIRVPSIVLANLVLIPRYGMIGAAWTTLGTYVLLLVLYVSILDRKSE